MKPQSGDNKPVSLDSMHFCYESDISHLFVYPSPLYTGAQFELPAYLSAVSMTVELFRRTIWSFFRLEHEHRQNTEGFRRVNVVPLHFNTGHKHKYNERQWVGWRVLIEIAVVTSIVIAISAFSVIVAQGATHRLQMSNPKDL